MKRILEMIEAKKADLATNDFCRWLRSESVSSKEKFRFFPSQAFLVMGFKDILTELYVEGADTDVQKVINEHCIEDTDHWKWYLQDLKALGFENSKNGMTKILEKTWADETKPIRDIVYSCLFHIRKGKDPYISLAVIEILESVFSVFIECIGPVIKKENLFSKLHYYGKTHSEKEESHAMWNLQEPPVIFVEEKECQVFNTELSPYQVESCREAIDEIFSLFNTVFSNWFEKRDSFFAYAQFTENSSLNNLTMTDREDISLRH